FDKAVPFAINGQYFESQLKKTDGTTNEGAFGRAVRLIADAEFDHILQTGFAAELTQDKMVQQQLGGFEERQVDFVRPIIEMTISRPFRDRAFMRVVRSAYENRCALTGLKLINGGGRPEVQAAHIRPVAERGPDSVRNG